MQLSKAFNKGGTTGGSPKSSTETLAPAARKTPPTPSAAGMGG